MTTDESTPRNEFPELDDDLYGALNDEERLDIAARRLMMKVLERTTGLKSDDVIVGSYTLGEVIGHGAMGTVYTATSPKYEGEVAVKILHRGDPGADALSEEALAHGQVLREAQAMAGVVHRNIVMVYEVGVCDQQAWLAMQLIRGVTLREWQQDPQHSWRSVLRMYVEAGRGLAAAHARKIVHGDFKPANVLIGEDGVPRVTDFGLASFGAVHHMVSGTPEYMAPEQLADGRRDVQSEQFSYCVALFEALCGIHPYARTSYDVFASTERQRTPGSTENAIRRRFWDALLTNMTREDLQWPGRLPPIPRRVRKALERGLRRDPAERFPTMNALLDALDLDSARKRSGLVSIAACFGIVAGGLGHFAYQQQQRASECRDPATRFAEVWNQGVEEAIAAVHPETVGEVALMLDHYQQSWSDAYHYKCERTVLDGEWDAWTASRDCLHERLADVEALVDALQRPGVDDPPGVAERVLASAPAACALDGVTTPVVAEAQRAKVEKVRGLLRAANMRDVASRSDEALATVEEAITQARALEYPPLLAEAYLERGKIRLRKQIYIDRETEDMWSPGMDDLDSVAMFAPHHRSLLIDAWIFRRRALSAVGRPVTDYPLEVDDAYEYFLEDQRANLEEQGALVAFYDGTNTHNPARLQEAVSRLKKALSYFHERDDLLGVVRTRQSLAQALLTLGTVEKGDQNADKANRLFDEGLDHIDAAIAFWKQEANLPQLGAASTTRAELLRQGTDEARARREIDRMIDELEDAPADQLSLLVAGIAVHWSDGRGLELARKAMAMVERPGFPVDRLSRDQLYLYAVGVALCDDSATPDELTGWSQKLAAELARNTRELQDVQLALARSYLGQVALRAQKFSDARDQFTTARELSGCEHLEAGELNKILNGLRDAYLGLDDPASAAALRQPIDLKNDPNRIDSEGVCLRLAS